MEMEGVGGGEVETTSSSNSSSCSTSSRRRTTPVIFRDIRRYYCDYCGIARSKKSLLTSHLLSHHKEEMEKEKEELGNIQNGEETKENTCEECGATFRKPAYLKQHMRSHSFERPFACPIDDCHSSYRRKDHLTRHLIQHQGKLFSCSVEGCNKRFAYQANMKRHLVEFHDEAEHSNDDRQKQHVCSEPGCGKKFEFESRLRKHEESHVKLDSVEVICCEPGCMKSFSNAECFKAHTQSCHRYINCEVCGTQQLKKNIKRHMRTHDAGCPSERIKCNFKGCLHTFSNKSNLNQHIKAVHIELRPFACKFAGCGKRFPFKHVRDNHEKTGTHVYIQGDFVEADEQFRSRPRGGLKRKCPTVDMLLRKRVTLPGQVDSVVSHASQYLAWLLSASDED